MLYVFNIICGFNVLLNFLVFLNIICLLFDVVKLIKSIIERDESCFKIIELKFYVSGFNL